MLEDSFIPLRPVNFVEIKWDCPQKGKGALSKMPDTSPLTGEEHFAKVYMGWEEAGLHFKVDVDSPFEDVFYPEVTRGDSVELFIDTRDVKTSSFNTKFCHHFFFLPQEIQGLKAGELTHFRTEDAHERCNPLDLHLTSEINTKGYHLQIFIPSHCLHGYDPVSFDRLGFNYRINRLGKPKQHFSAVTDEYAIENQPALWGSIKLRALQV